MSKSDILKLMAIIATEFSGRFEVTDERVGVWLNIIGHFEYQDAQAGVMAAIAASGQWPPTVGEVRNKIADSRKARYRADERRREARRLIGIDRDREVVARGRALLRKCVDDISKKRGL